LLDDLLSMHDPESRGHAAIALGLMNERSAIARISDIAKHAKFQPALLRSCAVALGLLGDAQLVPDLIEMLSTATSLSTQAAISGALGTIGDSRTVPPLLELLGNKQVTELARAFGAVALGIVADKEDLPWNAKISVGSNYCANPASLTDGKGGILDIL
jgi:HEAT repeat protein